MSNELAMALASEDYLRYLKAQKASEGKRFHELDSQSHIEKHQKTNRSNRALPTMETRSYPCMHYYGTSVPEYSYTMVKPG